MKKTLSILLAFIMILSSFTMITTDSFAADSSLVDKLKNDKYTGSFLFDPCDYYMDEVYYIDNNNQLIYEYCCLDYNESYKADYSYDQSSNSITFELENSTSTITDIGLDSALLISFYDSDGLFGRGLIFKEGGINIEYNEDSYHKIDDSFIFNKYNKNCFYSDYLYRNNRIEYIHLNSNNKMAVDNNDDTIKWIEIGSSNLSAYYSKIYPFIYNSEYYGSNGISPKQEDIIGSGYGLNIKIYNEKIEDMYDALIYNIYLTEKDGEPSAVIFKGWSGREYIVEKLSKWFPDTPQKTWFCESVKYVADKGFITGYTNGKFGPSDSLKRQDFVCILARIAKADLSKYHNQTSKLKDVQKGAYYAPAVNWAVDKGIIAGYNNGKFGVNDPITREQVAVILYRYMKESAVSNPSGTLAKFKDANRVSPFAITALAWAVQKGVINGTGDGKVNPTKSAARAEIAAIIMNMDKQNMFAIGNSVGTATDASGLAQLINFSTANAVNSKAGYNWSRHCTVDNIDVGSATGILNRIIQAVDSNADLNSVVGGFLGRGDKQETVPRGQTLDTIDVKKDDGTTEKLYHGSSYTLKATQLQAGDIQGLQISGDTYTFTIPDASNPDRSGNNGLSRFTNDIVVLNEVNSEIQEQIGSAVMAISLDADYRNIKVTVTIKDGKLVDLAYSFDATANLGLKAAIVNINGTGNYAVSAQYTDFRY